MPEGLAAACAPSSSTAAGGRQPGRLRLGPARGPGPGRAEPAGGAGPASASGRHRRTAASARRRADGRAEEARGRAGATGVGETRVPDPYQDAAYAARYADLVDKVAPPSASHRHAAGAGGGALCLQADGLDEYEVARLYSDGEFERRVAQQFEGDWKLRFHLAPPRAAGRQAGQARLRSGHAASVPPAGAPAAARSALRSVRLHSRGAQRSWSGLPRDATAILPKLNRGNLDRAVALASVPERYALRS